MNVLAMDLATTTGYAALIAGVRTSGSVCCPVKPSEHRGWRFIRFNHWLYKWRERGLDLVVYEKPIPFHSSQSASMVAFGLASRVEEFCARGNIRCEAVANTSIKKWAGAGRSDKEAMVKAAQILKPGVLDHNEADAIWLLDYAVAHFSN